MEALDLESRWQRRFTLLLASVYPALWLCALRDVLGSQGLMRWALIPAVAVFVLSAIGAFATARAGASPARQPSWARLGVYLSWGWLVPYCVVSAGAIASFDQLWPAFGILVLPAPLFLFLPPARRHFPLVALVSVALAGIALFFVYEASLLWKSKLALAMAVSAAPFWSLAAYLCLAEHLVRARTDALEVRREGRIALVSGLAGILLFFGLNLAMVLIAVAGFR